MLVLLDEHLPRQLANELSDHEVRTVYQQGWAGLKNGDLLERASQESFDVFVTADRSLEFQQNLPQFPMGFVVLEAPTNDLDDLLPLIPAALAAIASVESGEVVHVAA